MIFPKKDEINRIEGSSNIKDNIKNKLFVLRESSGVKKLIKLYMYLFPTIIIIILV